MPGALAIPLTRMKSLHQHHEREHIRPSHLSLCIYVQYPLQKILPVLREQGKLLCKASFLPTFSFHSPSMRIFRMSEHRKRVLFLCAHRSVRALMAASLFAARAHGSWDIWSTPVQSDSQELDLARQVLDEVGIPLLTLPQTTEPDVALSWDEGIILCSGSANT